MVYTNFKLMPVPMKSTAKLSPLNGLLSGFLILVFFLTVLWGFSSHIFPGQQQAPRQRLIDLNLLSYTLANQHDQFYSFIGVRTLSMVHIAVHDALQGIDAQYESYAYAVKPQDADATTAMISAGRYILEKAYPKRIDTIRAVTNAWLSEIPAGAEKEAGISLGMASAQAIWEKRVGDGHEKQGDYTPMTKPGDYQYTPGFDEWVLYPDFDYARPFTMDSVTQFRVTPPPQMNSQAYLQAVEEVARMGSKQGHGRTADQTHIAHWWAEFGEHSWNRLARQLAPEHGLSLHETARLFALLNVNLYDLYLASLESKYHYDTWRPYTAIRQGFPGFPAQPGWEPEMLTPPWPEYPSAHAAVGAGGAEILTEVLGTAAVSFRMLSISTLPGQAYRSYTHLDSAALDCAASRIYNGFHFRFATDKGLEQGRTLARHVLDTHFRSRE